MPDRISTAERTRLSPRERERRGRIAKQKIAIRVEGTEVYKLVKRIKLNAPEINKIFECDAWYARDESNNEVIWPEEWMNKMQASTDESPWRYVIVNRDKFPRFDQVHHRERYDGDTVIWCENVPYEVDAGALLVWLHAALEATLPWIVKAREKVEIMQEKLEDANAEFIDTHKQKAKDEEEAHYKELRSASLQDGVDKAKRKLDKAREAYTETVELMREEPLVVEPVVRDESMDKALWQVTFGRSDRADWLMEIPGELFEALRLAQPMGKPPVCLLPQPDGAADPRTNFNDEIGMRGVAFKRFRHGRGRERKVQWPGPTAEEAEESSSEEETSEEDSDASLDSNGERKKRRKKKEKPVKVPGGGNVVIQYEGGFQYGARHGEDTTTATFFYTLIGDFFQGTPIKAHELLYANGDKYVGNVAATYSNGAPASDLTTAYGDGTDDE